MVHIAAGGVGVVTGYFALFAGKGTTAHRFGLFIATGSFFLGQSDEIPEALRIWPVLWVLALTPLVLLLYWMWRVRIRKSLRGLVTRQTRAVVAHPLAADPAGD